MQQRELDRIDMEAVQVVEVAFRREMKKPSTEQRFGGLWQAHQQALGDEEPVRRVVLTLKKL